ncbi:MAG: hypothetical protein KF858_07470 [Candidatus Sumerlaeia bacterium]|nr:hypothetical protein [Candidatus Sumerlaeia bacterium]
MSYRHTIEQGRFLRKFVSEPVTSLVRQEDLSFCASRLLLMGQYVRRRDVALATLIEDCLQDLARLSPNGALDRLRTGQPTWPASPVYWCLACHVLAQVLSEFSAETPASTVTDLRTSLGTWFPRLRETLEDPALPVDDLLLVCLQCYLTQCAIFHDLASFEWGAERLFALMTPDLLASEVAMESTALLMGIYSRPQDEETQRVLAGMLERAAASGNELARRGAQSLAGIVLPDFSRASTSAAPRAPAGGSKTAVRKSSTSNRRSFGALVGETLGSYSWLIGVLIFVGIFVCCIGGVGKMYEWFENNSNVGQQSLSDWYKRAESANQSRREDDRAAELRAPIPWEAPETPEPVVATPEPTPEATPTPAPQPRTEQEIRAALQQTLERHTRLMQSRLGLPRQTRSFNGDETVTARAEYIRSNPPVITSVGGWKASAVHQIRWFENDVHVATHSIEARYEWNGTEWRLLGAARSFNVRDAHGNLVYATAPEERAWAEALFAHNPFYE